jgi:hypothetical protein
MWQLNSTQPLVSNLENVLFCEYISGMGLDRICYIFGSPVEHPVVDITPTFLTPLGKQFHTTSVADPYLSLTSYSDPASEPAIFVSGLRDEIKNNFLLIT